MWFAEPFANSDKSLDEQHRIAHEEASRAIEQSHRALAQKGLPLRPSALPTPRPAARTAPAPEQAAYRSLSPVERRWANDWLFSDKTVGAIPRRQFESMKTSSPAEWESILGGYKPGSVGRKVLTTMARAYQAPHSAATYAGRAAGSISPYMPARKTPQGIAVQAQRAQAKEEIGR